MEGTGTKGSDMEGTGSKGSTDFIRVNPESAKRPFGTTNPHLFRFSWGLGRGQGLGFGSGSGFVSEIDIGV